MIEPRKFNIRIYPKFINASAFDNGKRTKLYKNIFDGILFKHQTILSSFSQTVINNDKSIK